MRSEQLISVYFSTSYVIGNPLFAFSVPVQRRFKLFPRFAGYQGSRMREHRLNLCQNQ
ncbi:hypothetical protein OESDEN_03378 [Oesophagostomum dentatum]|uniref:Uncharacterized protein n=1 Tax=Oesophagostomum dentatum TaxID=61180 RepID=A0A0B1TGM1_OESDE|nr:hypothetical protein OESDEN_03378 [Oesophagostomum dentatum]